MRANKTFINPNPIILGMEFDDVIRKRRSIRKFLSVPVDREKLAIICAAGNEAPCAGNIANWRFILVDDDEIKHKLANAALEQVWIASAPAIIVVCSEPEKVKQFYGLRGDRLYAIQSVSACIENMLLAAVNLGLASCWVAAFDENAVSRVLKIPDTARPQAILPIGYPDEEVPRPMRFKLEDITFIGTYGWKMEFLDAFLRNYYLGDKVVNASKKLLDKVEKKMGISKKNNDEERPTSFIGKVRRKFKQ